MTKSKKRYLSILMLSLMLFTGCQLALEGKAGDSGEDRFVGVFVTRGSGIGPMTLKDREKEEMTEEELAWERGEGDEKYYARFSEDEKTFVFDHEGYGFFAVEIKESEDNIYSSIMGDVITDPSSHFSVGEDEEVHELEGTLFFTPESGEITWYFNPVYQEEDGEVYAVNEGTGLATDPGLDEGLRMSQWKEEVTTFMENGKSRSARTHAKVNLEMMYRPIHILLLEMDENSQILVKNEYEPGKLPEQYEPLAETAYIMVETQKKGPHGTVATREIFDQTKDSLETYYAREDGIVSKMSSALNWAK